MKRWVQLAIVSVMLIATINLGVLNHQTTKQRLEMNRIGLVSEMVDTVLYQGLCVMDGRTKELAAEDSFILRAFVDTNNEIADIVGQVRAIAEDAQLAVAEHENAVRCVVEQRMGSVVSIHTEFLYGIHPITGQHFAVNPQTQKPFQVDGAGVVIDKSGIALTARHMLDNSDLPNMGPVARMWVEFEDGTERDITAFAMAEGIDPDVGVVWFDPNGMVVETVSLVPNARETLYKGESIVVMGAPAGYGFSVEVGVVAAPYRDVDMPGGHVGDFLQISAHITGGNSGGPVFDLDGTFLGIVSCGMRGTGLTFVVPVDVILNEGLHTIQKTELINVP